MKKLNSICIVVIIANVTICSCKKLSSELNNLKTKEYTQSLAITPATNVERELREGLEYGFVEDVKDIEGEIENEMVRQFRLMSKAMQTADFNSYKKFLNKDAFEYFCRMAKQDGENVTLDDFAGIYTSDFRKMFDKIRKSGFSIETTIGNLERRVDYGDCIFIVLSNAINLTNADGITAHFSPIENTVGISDNGGKDWTFITLDDRFPTIFTDIYPEEVIDAIMGY